MVLAHQEWSRRMMSRIAVIAGITAVIAFAPAETFGQQPDWSRVALPSAIIGRSHLGSSARPMPVTSPLSARSSWNGITYDSDLIEAAKGIFGPYLNMANESERQRWLYEEQKARDQRRIANDINRSKPLNFPVSSAVH
jgi:hypothetical protein